MPHISAIKQSNYLKKEDCGRGILVTIKSVHEENVAREGAPPENKWCVSFDEQEKAMVLNMTNAQLIAQIAKSEMTEDWYGHQVVLYHDPNISFAGKLLGGIRVRAPRFKTPPPTPAPIQPAQRIPVAAAVAATAETNGTHYEDEIPF